MQRFSALLACSLPSFLARRSRLFLESFFFFFCLYLLVVLSYKLLQHSVPFRRKTNKQTELPTMSFLKPWRPRTVHLLLAPFQRVPMLAVLCPRLFLVARGKTWEEWNYSILTRTKIQQILKLKRKKHCQQTILIFLCLKRSMQDYFQQSLWNLKFWFLITTLKSFQQGMYWWTTNLFSSSMIRKGLLFLSDFTLGFRFSSLTSSPPNASHGR